MVGFLLVGCFPPAKKADTQNEASSSSSAPVVIDFPAKDEPADTVVDAMTGAMADEMNGEMKDTEEAEKTGHYAAYADGVIGNGMESVLFFHAKWCPNCRENDARLMTWYDQQDVSRWTYKIDYDANGQLRQAYGVTQQDTFVLIDGQGTEVKRVSFPTEDQLKEVIGLAS